MADNKKALLLEPAEPKQDNANHHSLEISDTFILNENHDTCKVKNNSSPETRMAMFLDNDSMENILPKGCVVLIETAAEPQPGSIVVFLAGDEYHCAIYEPLDNGKILLYPANHKYEALFLTEQDAEKKICGVVRAYQQTILNAREG